MAKLNWSGVLSLNSFLSTNLKRQAPRAYRAAQYDVESQIETDDDCAVLVLESWETISGAEETLHLCSGCFAVEETENSEY